jgi:predicted glycosyltransferase
MAGYNTVAEVLRARRPALLVPRTRPGQEQLVRARAIADMESYEMLHPDDLGPDAMRAAVDRLLELPAPDAPPDAYEGADRAAALVGALARQPRGERRGADRAPAPGGPA